jgi:hypothetical protein
VLPAQRLLVQHVQPHGKGAGRRVTASVTVRSFVTNCRKRRWHRSMRASGDGMGRSKEWSLR